MLAALRNIQLCFKLDVVTLILLAEIAKYILITSTPQARPSML